MRRICLIAFAVLILTGAVAHASKAAPWSGRWQRAAGEYGAGSGAFTLVQKGTRVTGAYHWKGCSAVFGGRVVGTANGRSLSGTFAHGGDSRGTLRLRLSANGRRITGSFKVTSGTCAGAAGAFDASYLGKL
jgi:hypothetical protein